MDFGCSSNSTLGSLSLIVNIYVICKFNIGVEKHKYATRSYIEELPLEKFVCSSWCITAVGLLKMRKFKKRFFKKHSGISFTYILKYKPCCKKRMLFHGSIYTSHCQICLLFLGSTCHYSQNFLSLLLRENVLPLSPLPKTNV